jgi:hypothetical protein
MSVSSLESGNLTLNTLTVNNTQYSDVSGYVPSQTVISSTKTSTSLSVSSITAPTITATTFFLSGNGATNPPNLSSGTSNNVIISSPNDSGLQLNTLAGSVVLSAGSDGLSINEAIVLDMNGATNAPNISSNSTNDFVVSCPNGSGIEINTPAISISLLNNNLGLSLDQPLYLNTAGTTNAPNISSNSTNNVIVSCPNNSGLTISTPQGNGTLSVNSSNQLTWNGVVIS